MTDGLSRRQALTGGLLLATAGTAFALTPRETIDLFGKAKLDRMVPPRIGDWSYHSQSGLVLPPEDQLSERLYAQLLTRVYIRGPQDPPVMLLIAQSPAQDGVLQVHRPEVCYPASGFALSQARVVPLARPGGAPIAARAFAAEGSERTEQLLYWTRIGHELPTNWSSQRMAVIRANLAGAVPDGVLVRISTVSPDRDWADAYLAGFVSALFGAITPTAVRALVG